MNELNGRKGTVRNPPLLSQQSDPGVVPPCKTPTNTWVTPVESVEGRPGANEIPARRNTPCTPWQNGVTTQARRADKPRPPRDQASQEANRARGCSAQDALKHRPRQGTEEEGAKAR